MSENNTNMCTYLCHAKVVNTLLPIDYEDKRYGYIYLRHTRDTQTEVEKDIKVKEKAMKLKIKRKNIKTF